MTLLYQLEARDTSSLVEWLKFFEPFHRHVSIALIAQAIDPPSARYAYRWVVFQTANTLPVWSWAEFPLEENYGFTVSRVLFRTYDPYRTDPIILHIHSLLLEGFYKVLQYEGKSVRLNMYENHVIISTDNLEYCTPSSASYSIQDCSLLPAPGNTWQPGSIDRFIKSRPFIRFPNLCLKELKKGLKFFSAFDPRHVWVFKPSEGGFKLTCGESLTLSLGDDDVSTYDMHLTEEFMEEFTPLNRNLVPTANDCIRPICLDTQALLRMCKEQPSMILDSGSDSKSSMVVTLYPFRHPSSSILLHPEEEMIPFHYAREPLLDKLVFPVYAHITLFSKHANTGAVYLRGLAEHIPTTPKIKKNK